MMISEKDCIPYPCLISSTLAGAMAAAGAAVVAVPWGGSHKCRWISRECLDLFSKWEGVISLHRQSQDPLVSVDDRMGHRCNSRVAYLQTYAGNIADTLWRERKTTFQGRYLTDKTVKPKRSSTADKTC